MSKRVFISWSGDYSQEVAQALCKWIPFVLQSADPWMSGNIPAGSRWNDELRKELAEASFGIICATSDNIHRPWILFEAGALGKKLENSAVVPYLLNLENDRLKDHPLEQFQSVKADEQGTFALVHAINNSFGDDKLPPDRLYKSFQKWWDELYKELGKIRIKAAKSELEVINSYEDRTHSIVTDLETLEKLGESELAGQSVEFSGVLSAFAISEADDPGLRTERDHLLSLARRGCEIRCIITPPGKLELNRDEIDKTIRRIEHLIKFLEDETNTVHKRISWAVSPFRQHNMYIIGKISCFEGFKRATNAGYDLTVRQSRPDAVQLYKDLYGKVFDNSKAYTQIGAKMDPKGPEKTLQICTLNRLKLSLQICQEEKKNLKKKRRNAKKG